MDDDEGDVRVRVDPSASHYHAGETAIFTISFTNTRTTPTPHTPRPSLIRAASEGQMRIYGRTRGHRRAVSSVSEAKMARPPTSPGLRRPTTPAAAPKYIPSSLGASASSQPSTPRQGLIGLRKESNGESRLHPVHSLSVSITSHDAFRELVRSRDDDDDVMAVNGSGTPTTPVGQRPQLPTRSRTSTGIPLSHPHARKQSAALDGAFPSALSLAHRLPATPSISTFSTPLAPITESSSSDQLGPSPLGHGRDHRNYAGYGPPRHASTPSLSVQAPTPPSASPSTPHDYYPDIDSPSPSPVTPHNENAAIILLAHAQLTGTLSLDPPSAALAATWRAAETGTGRRVVGGGRMGIGVSHPRTRPRAASGVGAWLGLGSGSSTDLTTRAAGFAALGGLASAGSSTASLASAPPDSPATRPLNGSISRRRGHQRATSMASFIPGMASISALLSPFGEDGSDEGPVKDVVLGTSGGMNGSAAADGMGPSATVEEGVYHVLETQPSVLAAELSLQLGETRSYTYTMFLPVALPLLPWESAQLDKTHNLMQVKSDELFVLRSGTFLSMVDRLSEAAQHTVRGIVMCMTKLAALQHAQRVLAETPAGTVARLLHSLTLPYLRRAAILIKAVLPSTINAVSASDPDMDEYGRLLTMLKIPPPSRLAEFDYLQAALQSWSAHFGSYMTKVGLQPIARTDYPAPYRLVQLPLLLDELFADQNTLMCKRCRTVPLDAAICLFCGTVCCFQSHCCFDESDTSKGECNMHLRECGGAVGLYFLARRCVILYLSAGNGSFGQAPYLDVHGEVDYGMRRGRRQFLNAQRFEELRRIWLTHGIPTFVARKLDGLMDYGGWDSL
ncbi:hypothetical protein FRC09_003296 [Ceratobasidium sp. 395]|nr:hypothetical protein FRC09_003296 [Ceratobasidium sp. 395]